MLDLVYDARGHVLTRWPYLHFGQYAMVRRGGAAAHSLAKSPPFPLRLRRPADFPAPDPFRPQDFRAEVHLPHYDVVLARGGPPAAVLFAGATVRPTLAFEGGGWRAWRTARGQQAAANAAAAR